MKRYLALFFGILLLLGFASSASALLVDVDAKTNALRRTHIDTGIDGFEGFNGTYVCTLF